MESDYIVRENFRKLKKLEAENELELAIQRMRRILRQVKWTACAKIQGGEITQVPLEHCKQPWHDRRVAYTRCRVEASCW